MAVTLSLIHILLACELHEGHMDAARAVAEAAGFSDCRIVDDLAGRPRVPVSYTHLQEL